MQTCPAAVYSCTAQGTDLLAAPVPHLTRIAGLTFSLLQVPTLRTAADVTADCVEAGVGAASVVCRALVHISAGGSLPGRVELPARPAAALETAGQVAALLLTPVLPLALVHILAGPPVRPQHPARRAHAEHLKQILVVNSGSFEERGGPFDVMGGPFDFRGGPFDVCP